MRETLRAAIAICIFCTLSISQARNNPAPQAGTQRGANQPAQQPAAQQSAQRPAQPPSPEADDDYVIGEEDVIEIRVWREPDFEAKGVVRPDGKIGVPGIGDVHASGLTPKQLAARITQGLTKLFTEEPPLVTVLVPEVRSKMVHIGGNIGRQGAYPLGRPLTVYELITRAGGLAPFAKAKEIQIIRVKGDVTTRFIFNYESYLEGKFEQNIQLRPGDIVHVP